MHKEARTKKRLKCESRKHLKDFQTILGGEQVCEQRDEGRAHVNLWGKSEADSHIKPDTSESILQARKHVVSKGTVKF